MARVVRSWTVQLGHDPLARPSLAGASEVGASRPALAPGAEAYLAFQEWSDARVEGSSELAFLSVRGLPEASPPDVGMGGELPRQSARPDRLDHVAGVG